MSTDGKDSTCSSETVINKEELEDEVGDQSDSQVCEQKSNKPPRKVSFPDNEHIVTQYFEPANPWQDVPATSRAQLAAEYLESCRRHSTAPIDTVLRQIRELPENTIGGCGRAPRLVLGACSLSGAAPVDALEAVFRRAQFRRLEIEYAHIDDEGAEALFDMMEYYETAAALSIAGPRAFGIRGWQAASRMIKRSCQLVELELSNQPLEPSHAPVLARALHAHACRLRALSLAHCALAGDALLCLVIALKSNSSVRELRLGDNMLGPHDAMQLASLLRFNTRIQLLDLSNNQIQDAGCGHIADALSEQGARTPPSASTSPSDPRPPYGGGEPRGLAFLILWNNQLTRNCAHHLTRLLQSQSLCVLNVGRNPVGAEAVRALSGGGAALASIGLQSARLGPDAAAPLQHLVANTPTQRLDLRDNKLGVPGLQAILACVRDNAALTQIDLDDPPDADSVEAQLTREIRALCGARSPPTPRLLRKISLTCTTAPPPSLPGMLSPGLNGGNNAEEERRSTRLRSPLPSPAGSPVPPSQSRFSVTRVTPEREGPASPASGSRFRVMQVAETPQRGHSSRFSVTRNYDSVYNPPQAHTPPPQAFKPPPQVYTPPPQAYEPPPQAYEPLPQMYTPPSQGYTPPPQPYEPPPQSHDPPPHAHDPPPQVYTPSPQASEPPPQAYDPPPLVYTPPPQAYHTPPQAYNRPPEACNPPPQAYGPPPQEYKLPPQVYNPPPQEYKPPPPFRDAADRLSHCETVHDGVLKTETTLHKNTTESTDAGKMDIQVQVIVRTESVPDHDLVIRGECKVSEKKKGDDPMKQIEAITEDLGNIIQEMKHLSTKTSLKKSKECPDVVNIDVPANVVLKKNKSESSLDSPDLEVSRLMTKKLDGSAFRDSSSSLEISGSSMESLADARPAPARPRTELDRRKADQMLLSGSSLESNTSESAPVNVGIFLNTSISSNESVSPITFGKTKMHDSLSSLDASVGTPDSRADRATLASADSGIEPSLRPPGSNEGTLTNTTSLKEKQTFQVQETLTSQPAAPGRGRAPERTRRPPPPPDKLEMKLPSHLEKLLSLFQHPTSLFSRSSDEDKKSTSNTPPRKDSSLASSFWSWTTADTDAVGGDSPEATDSTLSERVQVSFVDESFSKKLDSKTPSTDTENTLSEFQSLPTQGNSENSDGSQTDRVTELTTDNIVQTSLVVSVNCMDDASSGGDQPGACDTTDLIKPNDISRSCGEGPGSREPARAPAASTEEARLDYLTDLEYIDEKNVSADSGVTSLEGADDNKPGSRSGREEPVDLARDALVFLIDEGRDPEPENAPRHRSLAHELEQAEIKDNLIDLSPELVLDEAMGPPEVFARLKKANSLEDVSTEDGPKTKAIAFQIPETSPRDIPWGRERGRQRGSSPKSLPESFSKPYSMTKLDSIKKKKVSSLGKMAKDSLLALNMSEEEISEFRRSYKLASVESLRSLESVSEDGAPSPAPARGASLTDLSQPAPPRR